MAVSDEEIVWLNGTLVPRREARVSLLSPTAQFGANVFEGIRCYWDGGRLLGFRLREHSDRLRRSIKLLGIAHDWSDETLARALASLVGANRYAEDIVARAIVFIDGYGSWYADGPVGVFVSAIRKGRHLSPDSFGISCCISSWRRISDNVMSPRIKAGANYVNSRMAQMEAMENGYDSALLLNEQGKLAEGPGSCLFLVRGNILVTPSLTSSVLESVTRETVIEVARNEMGMRVEEREVDRTELYTADEAFLCGTAVELVPITRVDRFQLSDGKAGAVTSRLLDTYLKCARGKIASYAKWTTPITPDCAV